MSDPTNRHLSRRDALKLLGAAAGASVLANLPSKWTTPQSVAGVLPAHAATSACVGDAVIVKVDDLKAGTYMWAWFAWLGVDPYNSEPGAPGPEPKPTQALVGDTWFWSCQPGCLQLFLYPGPSGAKYEITITGHDPWIVDLFSGGGSTVLVDLATGEYSTTFGEPVGDCEWQEI